MAAEEKVAIFQREIEEAVQHYRNLINENGDASFSRAARSLVRIEGQEIPDFSSQYGSENSFSYVASNLVGKTSVFPSYGDFINACVFRTYGPWWTLSPDGKRKYKGTPADFISVDFIECLNPVSIEVYETYNPGSIVRILACDSTGGTNIDSGKRKWVTLWEGPPSPCMKPRIFSPALRSVDFETSLIRLELNHDLQDYYTELDGIRLIGNRSKSQCLDTTQSTTKTDLLETKTEIVDLEEKLISHFENLSTSKDDDGAESSFECYFTFLPEEIIQLILSYLNTRDLCRLAQTCRLLRDHCYDPLLYADVNLQPYWTQVVNSTFTSLNSRCQSLRRLNISWCGKGGSIHSKHFENFLKSCNTTLESLEVSSCHFINSNTLSPIVSICSNLIELNLSSCVWISDFDVFHYFPLKKLKRLNLYRTKIDGESLKSLFRLSVNLEHLNIGSCCKLNASINNLLKELGLNCKNLKSIDLWRMKAMDEEGLSHLYNNCTLLEGIDLGWCTALKSESNCFVQFANKCQNLKKLYLTANRTVNDKDILAVIASCPLMEQLDILGTREVSKSTILRLLETCKNMKMLDVSFCVGISFSDVLSWRAMFPLVSIKKSFQNISEL